MTIAIDLQSLTKIYNGTLTALDSISLTIKKGDFFALLGPNGAGKSTTINLISSLIKPTSGTLRINGFDIQTHATEAKKQLGIVPQEFNFSIFETCEQIVINQAGYYGVDKTTALSRTETLFKQLGLWDKRHVTSGRLSGGMKRRLMIARALVHEPSILILDEPTAGVDISLRRSMWDFLKERNKQGLTIILTTHYLEEAEQLCNHMAIIDKGHIIENTTMQDILSRLHSEIIQLECKNIPTLNTETFPYKVLSEEGHSLTLEIEATHSITDVILALHHQGITVDRLSRKTNRLEELFINLTEPSTR